MVGNSDHYFHIHSLLSIFIFFFCYFSTVTIVSTPTGTPVSGSTNTFDYPILSSVMLTCMVDPPPSGTVTYSWNTTGCYSRNSGKKMCFPNGQTTHTVSRDDVLARDAGTVMCTATTDSGSFNSEPFTLRISGMCGTYKVYSHISSTSAFTIMFIYGNSY